MPLLKTVPPVLRLMALVLLALLPSCGTGPRTDTHAALNDFRKQVDEALPAVEALMGVHRDGPVKVGMMTKAALGEFFEKSLEAEYPDGALRKRAQCFAEIGLLPRGYDLAGGLLELLEEEAGAVYDPAGRALIGISDLPRERKRAVNDRMILAHELAHALQDKLIDIQRQSRLGLENIDYEYSLRAVMEGMASGVMLAYALKLPMNRLPDVHSFWRENLARASGGALSRSPRYLAEYLLSPYAEGGAFVQSWLRANPGKPLEELLRRLPPSSEQVLHFEKYAEGDVPEEIDLLGPGKILPGDWELIYANTLGEFDLLQLFRTHAETEAGAAGMAAGWDGCRFEEYRNGSGALILFGSSAWDREEDAREFSGGFRTVLEGFRTGDDFTVVQDGLRVNFVIGSSDRSMRTVILEALVRAKQPGSAPRARPGRQSHTPTS